MGVFGVIGKIASSNVIERVEYELTKKQNREQTSKYCTYIENNVDRIHNFLTDLCSETQNIIEGNLSKKGSKLFFFGKGEVKKNKEQVKKNLQYLYLSRDYFTILSKNASGIALKNEELILVLKFSPYFDGVPVLDIDDEDCDDSLIGSFKEIGQELMSALVSSKFKSKHFDFAEYLSRYDEQIEKYEMPNIDAAIGNFKNTMTTLKESTVVDEPMLEVISKQKKCPNCQKLLDVNSKFCPECGTKIEIEKMTFCTQCGEPLTDNPKFCGNCGFKL
ncbi:MAG: zinc ribbon domain-containing protein [Clostridia bacterium]|nr:zinc ribbon domain-containing protein [Clostridia bacterium]